MTTDRGTFVRSAAISLTASRQYVERIRNLCECVFFLQIDVFRLGDMLITTTEFVNTLAQKPEVLSLEIPDSRVSRAPNQFGRRLHFRVLSLFEAVP